MKTIAVIDDQPDARSLVEDVINDALANLGLDEEWSVYATGPLAQTEEYPSLIEQRNICILVVDERLGEVPDVAGNTVEYTGSMLVNSLRVRYKELPIYGVTAHPEDSSLEEYFSQFDEVIKREDFAEKAELYVKRFLRTYQAFLEANEEELSELANISEKIALGRATPQEKVRAEAIQQNLEIPLTARYFGNRQEWLEEYTKVIDKYRDIQDEVKQFLEMQNREKEK